MSKADDDPAAIVPALKEEFGDSLGDQALSRFARAREGNLEKTKTMVENHLAWKQEFCPAGFKPSDCENEIKAGKAYIQGADLTGRPCAIVLARNHDMYVRDLDETKRFVIFFLDRLIQQCDGAGVEQFTGIFDLSGMPMKACDQKTVLFLLRMLEKNYPERLGDLYLVNPGWVFWILWNMISAFIPAKTKKKIHFLSSDYKQVLCGLFDPSVISVDFGGTVEAVHDPGSEWDELCAEETEPGAPGAT
jgi:hypothetical protein